MLWYNKFRLAIVVFAVLVELTGCVVTPLYAPHKTISKNLRTIHIEEPKTEFEQVITNQLSLNLYGGLAQLDQKYKLSIDATYYYRYNNLSYKSSLTASDMYSTAGAVYANLTYILHNSKGKFIAKGHLSTSTPYVRLAQGYANLQAQKDACHQAATDLAEQLTLKLVSCTKKRLGA